MPPLEQILSGVDTARRLAKVGKLLAAQNKFDAQVLESLKRIEFSKQLQKRGRKANA